MKILLNLLVKIFGHYFNSVANPNGFGNNFDSLIVTYEGKVIFEN